MIWAVGLVGLLAAVLLASGTPRVRGKAADAIAEALLARALAACPDELRSRYAQEWHADFHILSERPLDRVVWALGLLRASRDLQRATDAPVSSAIRDLLLRTLPRAVTDALAFGIAYAVAFAVRFGASSPEIYGLLFQRTFIPAVVGGVASMALLGAYRTDRQAQHRSSTLRVIQGAGLATILLVAYVAMAQPILVAGPYGQVAVNLPASVCAIFAVSVGVFVGLFRGVVGWSVSHFHPEPVPPRRSRGGRT